MNNSKVFLGYPIDFIPSDSNERKVLCKIYPPKIKDLVTDNNFNYVGLLTITQEEIEDSFANNKKLEKVTKIPTPFEYILTLATEPQEAKTICAAIEFFIKEPVTILAQINAILIGDLETTLASLKPEDGVESLRLITKDNFFEF